MNSPPVLIPHASLIAINNVAPHFPFIVPLGSLP
jgi:hypothetical protein